jgi:hypothetical protein
MAETVKVLSDQGIPATIVLVGVAESVTGLIDEHASTERNLTQVPMPRMTLSERHEIISRGLARVEMSIADEAAQRISLLSQGLAQFVHLLAQRAAIIALNDQRDGVTLDDVSAAIKVALIDLHISVSSAYYDAVKSNRDTLYPDVVLACALVAGDERGFFTAKALVEPMTRLEGRQMAIPAFGPHLDRLAGERGPILRKDGERRRFRYRFINPLMQPYVLMKGLQDGRIRDSDLSGQ